MACIGKECREKAYVSYEENDGWVIAELQSDGYRNLLRMAQKNAPFLRYFKDWADVIASMREGNAAGQQKDNVLRSIFHAHSADGDPRWRMILLAIFWPGLKSIHHQKCHWDTDPDELWQNMVWVFLQVLCKIDVAKRPERLAQKVINDTVHRLCDIYRKKWTIAKLEVPLESSNGEDDDTGEIIVGAKDDIDYNGIDLRILQESAIKQLRKHLNSRRISEEDFLLLVGTRVYGKSVADYAREAGMNYELARKRRLRAEAHLRRNK